MADEKIQQIQAKGQEFQRLVREKQLTEFNLHRAAEILNELMELAQKERELAGTILAALGFATSPDMVDASMAKENITPEQYFEYLLQTFKDLEPTYVTILEHLGQETDEFMWLGFFAGVFFISSEWDQVGRAISSVRTSRSNEVKGLAPEKLSYQVLIDRVVEFLSRQEVDTYTHQRREKDADLIFDFLIKKGWLKSDLTKARRENFTGNETLTREAIERILSTKTAAELSSSEDVPTGKIRQGKSQTIHVETYLEDRLLEALKFAVRGRRQNI